MKKCAVTTIRRLLVVLLLFTFLTGCQKEVYTCPFSSFTWESTAKDVVASEGEPERTYESIYGGETYTYTKEYKERTGIVKYMFDDKEQLMSIAWTCSMDSQEELQELYDKIHKEAEDAMGESGYDTKNVTNYGDVWHRPEGSVIISAMTTEENVVLQFAFLNPAISKSDEK